MKFLLKENQEGIKQLLLDRQVLTVAQLDKAQQSADKAQQDVFSYLIQENVIDEEEVTKAVAQTSDIPYIYLDDTIQLDPRTLDLLPPEISEKYMAVPLGLESDVLVVAMLDADDIQKVNYLSQLLKRRLKIYIASETSIRAALRQREVKIDEEQIRSALALEDEKEQKPKESGRKILSPLRNNQDATDIQTLEVESPASKALSDVLQYAIRVKASDVHMEALEDSLRIRIRIDGVLSTIANYPKALEPALLAKIKICSRLKVDEKRIPQDGEFVVNIWGNNIDLRVAISPTIFGEQVIIRILDRSGLQTGLENLGYCGQTLQVIKTALKESSGMILTSGPTGSGKTTSLYALLQEVSNETVKVITLEDPAEYKMPGINQIQINKEIGLTFANGLRSVLRQDPDVVMVGEIRDSETASLAIQAALTGHLVFSTLHTNSAAGILPRLLDMGIEPFLIASTIRVVIGQRLIRRNADDEDELQASESQKVAIKQTLKDVLPKSTDSVDKLEEIDKRLGYNSLPFIDDKEYTLYQSALTTNRNPNSSEGFRGRIGIYEAFNVSEEIQKLIIKRATSSEIQNQARAEGMITMRQAGYLKALAGISTLSEVDRVITDNNV